MGNKAGKQAFNPPPYSVDVKNDVACYKERALNSALMKYNRCDVLDSTDILTSSRKRTIQTLSALVYGKRLAWEEIPAYVYTAREINQNNLVLPGHIAEPFLSQDPKDCI